MMEKVFTYDEKEIFKGYHLSNAELNLYIIIFTVEQGELTYTIYKNDNIIDRKHLNHFELHSYFIPAQKSFHELLDR